MYTRRKGMSDAQDAIASYDEQIADLDEQKSEIQVAIEGITGEQQETRMNLARGVLSGIDTEQVNVVSKATGAIHLLDELAKCHQVNNDRIERFQELEKTEYYLNSASLIDPDIGTFTRDAKEYQMIIDGLSQSISDWENAPYFMWVKKDISRGPGFLVKLKSAITFAWLTRARKYRKCEAKVGTLTTAFTDYDKAQKKLQLINESYDEVCGKINDVQSILQEHEELKDSIGHFEAKTLEQLHNCLAEYFYSTDLLLIKDTIQKEALPMLAKLEALRSKLEHLTDQKLSCENEIRDRQERKSKVETVLMKWRRSSRFTLSSDKTKWLVDVPSNCRKRTHRFCSSYSSQREFIVDYDDYNAFSALIATGLVFSTFDVFAAENEVDGYVANQIYSEASAIAEMPEDMVLDTAAVAEVMSAEEEMVSDAALDDNMQDMDNADENFADES